MKIKQVEFVTSVADLKRLPKDGLPQIAFAGRSNVGKSSLLNTLCNRKKLALVSSTPGKTRLINFFRVNNNFYFVDLPGYGYAKVSKMMQESWKRLIESYLQSSPALCGVVVLTDIRLPVQPGDAQLIEVLSAQGMPLIVVGTKADKLSKSQLQRQLAENVKALEPFGITRIIPFSSVTGTGKVELLGAIDDLLALRR